MSKLTKILATIGVQGVEDKHVIGRAGAEQAILDWVDKEIIGEGKGVECSRVVKLRAEMRKKLGR